MTTVIKIINNTYYKYEVIQINSLLDIRTVPSTYVNVSIVTRKKQKRFSVMSKL